MDFKTDIFTLRPWQINDAPYLMKHANNKKIADQLRDGFPHPYTLNEARKWLTSVKQMENAIILAIEIENEPVGSIGLVPQKDVYHKSAEIGYWLSEMYWGKGIMTKAVQVVTQHAVKKLGIIRVFAGVFENNTASMKVLEKAGFKLEAIHKRAVIKNGVIMDEFYYAFVV